MADASRIPRWLELYEEGRIFEAAALAPSAGGTVSLAVTNSGTDSLWFWSRNYGTATARPMLVLTYSAP